MLSFGIDKRWRGEMSNLIIQKDCKIVLDLASGTGDSATGMLKSGCTVFALDISQNMLLSAVKKLKNHHYIPVVGSGYHIPFKDETFDAVTCAFGIRNMHETPKAVSEIFRVLRYGGWIFILEFSMPKTKVIREFYRIYLKHYVPFVAGILSCKSAYRYLGDSIEAFHSRDNFCNILQNTGFKDCQIKDLTLGTVTLYWAVKG